MEEFYKEAFWVFFDFPIDLTWCMGLFWDNVEALRSFYCANLLFLVGELKFC